MPSKEEQMMDYIRGELAIAYNRGAAAAFADVVNCLRLWKGEGEFCLDAAIEAIEQSAKDLVGEQNYKDAMDNLTKRSRDR